MKLFDKFNKIAEKLVTSVEATASDINKTYKEKGLNGFLEQASDNIDNFSQKTKDYYDNIAQTNKQILNSNTSKSLEDKIATAAAVVVNTTQTIVQDAVNVTVKTAKNVVDTTEVASQADNNTQNARQEDSTVSNVDNTNVHKTPAKIKPLSETLDQGQIASLDATPLSIILENMGATLEPRSTDRWKTLDNSTVILAHNKWYCFNNSAQGQGAISFIKFALNSESCANLEDPQEDKILFDQALLALQEYQKTPNYQTRVSEWIQKENEFAQKKKEISTIDKNNEVSEETPKVTKPRVRRVKKIEAVETTSSDNLNSEPPKRKRKMN